MVKSLGHDPQLKAGARELLRLVEQNPAPAVGALLVVVFAGALFATF